MHHLLVIAAAILLSAPALAHDPERPEGGYVVSNDLAALPAPVRHKREQLLAAAASGEISRLGEIIAGEPTPPTVSFGMPDDPVAFLKSESADGEGLEILAILADVLEAPYAVMDGGDGQVFYVWPYLAAYEDITGLDPAERVHAYQIMGHERFEAMKAAGSWYYWRVYLGGEGELQAFVAGD